MQSCQCFQCIGHTGFDVSGTNALRSLSRVKVGTHSAFRERSHTRAYTPKQGPSLPRPQRGHVPPARLPPKEQPEKADARLWRVSAFSGVAAPLGCVIFLQFGDVAVFSLCAQYFLNVRGRGVLLPSACFACSRNAGRPLAKAANLPFSEVGWSSLIPAVQKQ